MIVPLAFAMALFCDKANERRSRMKWRGLGYTLALLMGFVSPAGAAGFFTNGVPVAGGTQYPSTIPLTGNETLPADTNLTGGLNPASEAITTTQLSGFAVDRGPQFYNLLIGGDATTNLWQRGTTGASVTTTATYGGPDRWFYWSGTNTAMTVSRTASPAAALPAGYNFTFRMQRTAAQTGVVQMCMAQEITSNMTSALRGAIVMLNFHAYTGANFSPASPFNMTAYVVYGTGTDEGSVNMAFGLNGGGGGSAGWTGQTNATAAVIALGGTAQLGRYAAVASIPVTATEVGVALCYTPVGTAGTTDAIFFSGIQLAKYTGASAFASATVGYSCDNAFNVQIQCAPFARRATAEESLLQYAYYYQISEGAATTQRAMCTVTTANTTVQCLVPFPAPMRVGPTMSYAVGFATETTTASTALNNCTGLATSAILTGYFLPANATSVMVQCSNSSGSTYAVGLAVPLYDNGGTGLIKASAEL